MNPYLCIAQKSILMYSFKSFVYLIFILLNHPAFCQLSKGMLKLEAVSIKMNGEEAPPDMVSNLGGMEISLYSSGSIQKSVMNIMMMKTISIMDMKKDSLTVYMDMMGKKYKISESRESNWDTITADVKHEENSIEIKEYPGEVKTILGYKCHRVDIIMKIPEQEFKKDDFKEIVIRAYCTREIKFDASYVTQTSKKIPFKGTPLEYNITMGNSSFKMEVTMLAKEYKREFDAKELLPPAGNYKELNMDQFQKEMRELGR